MDELSDKNILYVVGGAKDFTYVGADGVTYCRGRHCWGDKYNNDYQKMRTIKAPEGVVVKKVVQGKCCRWMLSTENKIYYHGKLKHYQATSSIYNHQIDTWGGPITLFDSLI